SARERQHPTEALLSLIEERPHAPEPPERPAQPQALLGGRTLHRPRERGAHVLVLLIHPRQPPHLFAPQEPSLCSFRQTGIILQVVLGQASSLRRRQTLQPNLPDRLQHPHPQLTVGPFLLAEQALVHQGGDTIEHIDFRRRYWVLGIGCWAGGSVPNTQYPTP